MVIGGGGLGAQPATTSRGTSASMQRQHVSLNFRLSGIFHNNGLNIAREVHYLSSEDLKYTG